MAHDSDSLEGALQRLLQLEERQDGFDESLSNHFEAEENFQGRVVGALDGLREEFGHFRDQLKRAEKALDLVLKAMEVEDG